MKLEKTLKLKLLGAGISGGLFLLLILLLRTLDVAAIGPAGTEIGLATLNGSVRDALGTNAFWYDFTELFGFLELAVCALFAVMGALQLLKRRSLWKVDHQILALGVFYAVVMGCYVLFELVVVNCRPILMAGELVPEASFPSSHALLICSVMGSAAMVLKAYVHQKELKLGLQAGCVLIALLGVVGRLLSGVHWFTDILGSVLLSCALLCLLAAALEILAHLLSQE